MTVVAALQTGAGVLFGADSATLAGWDVRHHGAPSTKVWDQGPFVFGETGAVRWAQLVRYVWEPPEQTTGEPMAWLVRSVMPSLQALADKHGLWVKPKESEPPQTRNTMLMAYAGTLYRIDCDFTVLPVQRGYDALGCGEDLALGALYATTQVPAPATCSPTVWAQQRILLALQAAAEHNAAIRGPFTLLVQPSPAVLDAEAEAAATHGATNGTS